MKSNLVLGCLAGLLTFVAPTHAAPVNAEAMDPESVESTAASGYRNVAYFPNW
jgi:hypothetical protein